MELGSNINTSALQHFNASTLLHVYYLRKMPLTSSNQQPVTSDKRSGILGSHEKKVLIVSYYWPPSGGSGVQRWLKFVKYLPSFGWQPFVFTPENPSFEIRDDTLMKDVPTEAEVIRFPIWEPYGLFRNLSTLMGKRAIKQTDLVTTGKRSLFQSIDRKSVV